MAYWLVKSEPSTWSWDDQVSAGTEGWDGVRNHQAANNLKAMEIGDRAFFYHSGSERAVVGIVEIVRTHYPDDTDPSGRFVQVDVKTVQALPQPVTLAQIKADPALSEMVLVRHTRLSVSPVTEDQWQRVCAMGGL